MTTKFRAAVTHIEAVRKFRIEDWMTYDKLMAQLTGEDSPSAVRDAGTALHHVLQFTTAEELTVAKANGFTFVFTVDGEIALRALRELRGQKTYQLGDVEVDVRAKVDGIDGMIIDDHKLTETFDAESYADSYQWRLYLDIFGAQRLRFNVFEAKQDRNDPFQWEIRAIHQLTFWRYPELEADVARMVRRYAEFAAEHLTSEAIERWRTQIDRKAGFEHLNPNK